ncbi:MAG: ABC transporter ATP-binding protein, partial [Lachnospiraceae bacterium]|nr:ABC transporter ATP-binding protein [Lachnospiraceae bacterium]
METYKNNRQLVLHFLKGSKRFFALSLTFATLVSLFDMISPKIISFTVDSVIGDKAPEVPRIAELLIERLGGIGALKAHPLFIACAVAAIGALAALSRFLFRTMNARGAETFVCTMREELFSHIMYLPYAWHEKNSTGDIIQRCTSDVQTIKRFVSEQMVQLIRTIIMITMA